MPIYVPLKIRIPSMGQQEIKCFDDNFFDIDHENCKKMQPQNFDSTAPYNIYNLLHMHACARRYIYIDIYRHSAHAMRAQLNIAIAYICTCIYICVNAYVYVHRGSDAINLQLN